MTLPFNITNPGIWIDGILTTVERNYVTDLVLAGATANEGDVLTWVSGAPAWQAGGGGGYTNLTQFVNQTAWRVFYSNGDGDVVELALGADGTFLKSNGATSAPSFAVPAGSGDVSKVGTPVNNQLAVWTGDGTIEGDASLTFDTTTDTLATVIYHVSGQGGGQNYLISAELNNALHIQSQTSATIADIDLSTKDQDGTDSLNFRVYGVGDSGAANNERINLGWDAANSYYRLRTAAAGTGTVRPLHIFTDANTTQLVLNTDGTVSFGGEVSVPDEAYGVSWNGSLEVPTKNAIYDKIETIGGGGTLDQAYDFGGAGAGRSITANSGAVEITVPDTSNNAGLIINQNDVTNNQSAIEIITASQFHWPEVELYNSTVAAAGQDGYLGILRFYGEDSASNKQEFANMNVYLSDNTSGAEKAAYNFNATIGGSLRSVASFGLNGLNGITVGSSVVGAGVVQSAGNQDLILQTGNSTTGSITITDGANGNISLAPNGTGEVHVKSSAGGTDFYVYDSTAASFVSLYNTATSADVWAFAAGGSQGGITVSDGATGVYLRENNAGTTGPYIELYHNSATPAANDYVGEIAFYGEDSAGAKTKYGSITTKIVSTTSGDVFSDIIFSTPRSGGFSERIGISNGALYPVTSALVGLGTNTKQFLGLYLSEGAQINWDNGDLTLTQTGNRLTVAGGNLDLETGGNILVNNANPKRSLVLSASGGNPTTTSGCASPVKVEAGTNDIDYYVLDFDTTTEERAFWNVVMPDNWDGGTVTAQFYWTNASGSSTQTVAWGIKARAFADDAAIDQAYGTEVTTTDTWLAQGDVHISAVSSAITVGGSPAGGQYVVFNVGRKVASDNMTGDARLLSVRIEYGINAYSE